MKTSVLILIMAAVSLIPNYSIAAEEAENVVPLFSNEPVLVAMIRLHRSLDLLEEGARRLELLHKAENLWGQDDPRTKPFLDSYQEIARQLGMSEE